ncbi:MAG: hypothetical protein OQK54_08590 [Gammaproteobacteria bacterium]|nr:hypothetical protein [Gammaproteobacteria bacterium]
MDINNYRAGHYKQQYEYKSFVPEPINHPWEVVDGEVQRLLSDADRALGELNAFRGFNSEVHNAYAACAAR